MIVRLFGLRLLPPSARRPELFKRACLKALGPRAKLRNAELNLIFLDRRRMRLLNKRYLNHDYDTDVIAFPYDRKPALGDVFISAYRARRQARELGHDALKEALTLAVHGTLHLVGYGDKTPAQKRRMFRRQERILRGQK